MKRSFNYFLISFLALFTFECFGAAGQIDCKASYKEYLDLYVPRETLRTILPSPSNLSIMYELITSIERRSLEQEKRTARLKLSPRSNLEPCSQRTRADLLRQDQKTYLHKANIVLLERLLFLATSNRHFIFEEYFTLTPDEQIEYAGSLKKLRTLFHSPDFFQSLEEFKVSLGGTHTTYDVDESDWEILSSQQTEKNKQRDEERRLVEAPRLEADYLAKTFWATLNFDPTALASCIKDLLFELFVHPTGDAPPLQQVETVRDIKIAPLTVTCHILEIRGRYPFLWRALDGFLQEYKQVHGTGKYEALQRASAPLRALVLNESAPQ